MTPTSPLIRSVAPAIVTLFILAACTSEPEAATTESAADSPSVAASVEAEESAPAEEPAAAEESAAAEEDATVVTADSEHGEILTDAEGMTIYFFANDVEGMSHCTGDCLESWPPVTVDDEPTAGEGVTAELGTISAAEGGDQLTVNGFPAYYFAGDSEAGDTNGQGVGGVWWVFGSDGEPIEE